MAERTGALVRVRGEGLLAQAVAEAVRPDAGRPDLVCSASDSWETAHQSRAWCRTQGFAWLGVHTELDAVLVGPLERPGLLGCARCAEGRRHRASADPDGAAAVWATHAEKLRETASTLLSMLAASTVAALVAAEAERLDSDSARTAGALLRVDLRSLRVTRHTFLPDPCCPDCAIPAGAIPAGAGPGSPVPAGPDSVGPVSADAGTDDIRLRPRPKPAPESYRVRPDRDPAGLRASYVDPEVGLIRELRYGTSAGLMLVQAPMRLREAGHTKSTESGYGRTRDYRSGETVAICEALERYGGLQQGDTPTVRRARYSDVRDEAIDIAALGHYSPEAYSLPGFRCQPFDPDYEYCWVTGYSFARRGPVLVPERLAYYGGGAQRHRDPPFVLESSNGAAIGGCLEEAILHGLLEVVERDAFLLAWHARLPVPAVDPDSAVDRTTPLLTGEIEREHGYRVSLFDTTLEHGIPSVWAMAARQRPEPNLPRVCCTSSAHPQPERAISNALAELGPILAGLIDRYPRETERIDGMVHDSGLVREMEDHWLLYADPRVFDRFDFLTAPRETLPIGKAFAAERGRIANDDLTDDLLELTGRLLEAGLDVVAVDQTTSEHRVAGLCCAKVLVPGMLPMTFGHAYQRLGGLARLREVPALLGYANGPLLDAELNTHPHPFP